MSVFLSCHLREHSSAISYGIHNNATIISELQVKWAVETIESYKSPWVDGIYSVLIKEGMEILMHHSLVLFCESFKLWYIPKVSKKLRVVFTPKRGRSCIVTGHFRPISLTTILRKITERIIDSHIRETPLVLKPLHVNQHAFMSGKSLDSTLHQLVTKIERTADAKEIALCTLLNIEGS